MTDLERIAVALESIAASLVKMANPAFIVGPSEDGSATTIRRLVTENVGDTTPSASAGE